MILYLLKIYFYTFSFCINSNGFQDTYSTNKFKMLKKGALSGCIDYNIFHKYNSHFK